MDNQEIRHFFDVQGSCDIDALRQMLSARLDLSMVNFDGHTLLTDAIKSGYVGAIKELAKHGADLNQRDGKDRLPVVYAVRQNQVECMEALIHCGARLQTPGNALMHSVRSARMVRLLAKHGIDPNSRDQENMTPLHAVVHYQNCYEIIHALVELGADTEARDNYNYTPMDAAFTEYAADAGIVLIDAGANCEYYLENEVRREFLRKTIEYLGREDLLLKFDL